MGRLPGFNYKMPYFYMVTIKRRPGLADFSILRDAAIQPNAITTVFQYTIDHFHTKWRCLEQIHYYIVMPDHLHLILKILDVPNRVSLCTIVRQLIHALTRDYCEIACKGQDTFPAVFEYEWHDWIVLKHGQLDAFRLYIVENPSRAWRRRQNRRYFTILRDLEFAGRLWHAYGNETLLELPVLEWFRCSRKWSENTPQWQEAVVRASRIGPGGAGIGTFMSHCEKACGNAIIQAGGSLVVLRPEGFAPRWHPSRNQENLCAEGRMLFLSLYEPSAGRLDNATLYQRCHEMGTIWE